MERVTIDMDGLRAEYRAGLRRRIETLEGYVPQLEGSETAREAVRRQAHSLKGSGQTYGYPEITTAAGPCEAASDEDLLERLQALLDVLRATVGASI